ncbi:bifunctional 4-hydroxy-2-oxoglutarate aldolase/2-dehydro-3-deoxy-phosphogluconate aldolase [Nesterenkonia sp. HG001]|uniref:bifunctional 4-hydroxy-2-oxoglutarate aldolase/2-dehydro-3-deoxy-phosphogluconate aldolase n=1 Tax=Nesterenkonia sp. HG001 TaxID=2983207 RepID=UPI002AC6DD77|nr:bifunctional 4-hydroxy-2-oxoglutarate aldolase/2-dehydro-3-deoxy-phosphogluconate aldolase [Nesterenkonia sp. HG001]MDZ5076610.1 bifunctional 4-hydroxy-2-oxoglutarate aldolase/2-dehydro-3-deoxy-phosphogluconate aldolase [Nesterenkonia sp. HG001]
MVENTREVLAASPVIPVVTIDDVEAAVPVAQALVDGGVPIIEVTLRTPQGLEALRRIAAEVPTMLVGAGTVLNPQQAEDALEAGAEFLVTPGLSQSLLAWIPSSGVPCLPGVSTLGQVMDALDAGITELKFFPAEAAGGVPYLKAVAGPVPGVTFCPTGGIGLGNVREYLQLKNVACVGGSWLTPQAALAAGDWDDIRRRAAEAAKLGG